MARQLGTLNVTSNFEPKVKAPLDARTVTKLKADLTSATHYPNPYIGLLVAVEEDGKLYQLIALPVTDAANWTEVGAGFDPSTIEAEIAKKAEGYIETTTVSTGTSDSVVLQEGQIVQVSTIGEDPQKTFQGVVAVDASGTYIARDNLVAEIDCDGDGKVYVYTTDGDGLLEMDSQYTGVGNIDGGSIVVITETVHKIDSRLLPKGDKSETADYLEEALTVKEAQGKYKVGDIIPADTALEDVIKNMLTKTNYPTITEPSATLTGSGNKLLETGATLNATFTVNFDRGSISPAYGTSGFRSGAATAYSLNGGGEQAENTFANVTVSESNSSFTAVAKYDAGEQPKDDEGEDYMDACDAGQVSTNTVTYEFVDPIYSNAADINVIAKEALVSRSTGQKIFVFPPQTETAPECFEIPASWTVLAVEVLNDLSGKWEDDAREFTVTDVTHPNAGNVDTAYKRYTDNRGYGAGSRSIRVRWS